MKKSTRNQVKQIMQKLLQQRQKQTSKNIFLTNALVLLVHNAFGNLHYIHKL